MEKKKSLWGHLFGVSDKLVSKVKYIWIVSKGQVRQ